MHLFGRPSAAEFLGGARSQAPPAPWSPKKPAAPARLAANGPFHPEVVCQKRPLFPPAPAVPVPPNPERSRRCRSGESGVAPSGSTPLSFPCRCRQSAPQLSRVEHLQFSPSFSIE